MPAGRGTNRKGKREGSAVSRISACKDPSRWHAVVINWLDRQRERLKEKREKENLPDLERLRGSNEPPPGEPLELRTRFLQELPIYLGRAEHSVPHANALVAYFYVATKKGQRVDSRVVDYIDDARERYCCDPRRNIKKALGLMRSRAGNPSGTSAKRRLSPEEGHIAIGQAVNEITSRRSGRGVRAAIRYVADTEKVSETLVKNEFRKLKSDRQERERLGAQRADRKLKSAADLFSNADAMTIKKRARQQK